MSFRTHSPASLVRILVRRRWLILVPFACGVAMMPFLAKYVPARYRSEALILVIPQQVPDTFVMPTVRQTLEERLAAITDQILSRNQLEKIIKGLDLYPAQVARDPMHDVVERMRGDVTTIPGGKNSDSFRIAYVSDNPEKAQKVTEQLVGLYKQQNDVDRAQQADLTTDFLAAQLADARRNLVEQEKKLEEYRKLHAGQLPSQLTGNLQAIQNANMQLLALNESTNRMHAERMLLGRQLADAIAPELAGTPPVVPPLPASGSDPVGAVQLSPAQQLAVARARRTFLLQRFTTDYPEVVRLDKTIAELEERVASQAPLSDPIATLETPTPATPAEVAQQKRVQDLKANLAVLDYQLGVKKLEAEVLRATISQYQAKVDAVPGRESDLIELTRDYSTLQTVYSNLLLKSQDSVIAANLERRKIGEQFRTVDAASYPEKPFNHPQRQRIMASGAVAGLVFGLLAVALLEYRDSSFRRADEVLKAISLPVLASIPVMISQREKTTARWRSRLLDVAGVAVLLAAGAVLLLWRWRLVG